MSLFPDDDEIKEQSESIEEYLDLENVNPNGIMSKSGSYSYQLMSKWLIKQHQEKKQNKQIQIWWERWLRKGWCNMKYAVRFGAILITSFLEMILRGLSMYMLSCPETRLFKIFGAVFRMFKPLCKNGWNAAKEQFRSDWDQIGTDKEAQEGFVKSSQAFILSLVNFIRCILGENVTNRIVVGITNVLVNMIIKPICKGTWQGIKWIFHAILNSCQGEWQNMDQVHQKFRREWSELGQDIKSNFGKLCTGDEDMTNLTAYQNKYFLKGSKKAFTEVAKTWNNTPVSLLVLTVLSGGLFGVKWGFAGKIFHISKQYIIAPFIHGWKLGVKAAIAVSKYCLGVIVNLVNQLRSFYRKHKRYLATGNLKALPCLWLAVMFGINYYGTVTGGVLQNLE